MGAGRTFSAHGHVHVTYPLGHTEMIIWKLLKIECVGPTCRHLGQQPRQGPGVQVLIPAPSRTGTVPASSIQAMGGRHQALFLWTSSPGYRRGTGRKDSQGELTAQVCGQGAASPRVQAWNDVPGGPESSWAPTHTFTDTPSNVRVSGSLTRATDGSRAFTGFSTNQDVYLLTLEGTAGMPWPKPVSPLLS